MPIKSEQSRTYTATRAEPGRRRRFFTRDAACRAEAKGIFAAKYGAGEVVDYRDDGCTEIGRHWSDHERKVVDRLTQWLIWLNSKATPNKPEAQP